EMRRFLALPIEEKSTHTARALAKLKNELVGELEEEKREEENEKKKSLKQIKSKAALLIQRPSTRELKSTTTKGEKITKESKHDLIFMERQQAVLELSLMTKRSEILRMEKTVTEEERKLKQLERLIEGDNHRFEEFLRENERKSVEARMLFEREEKSKQEKNVAIKKLTAEIGTIESELDKYEEALIDYQKYREFLFRLSPPEWQEEQKTKSSKTKSSPGKDGEEIQNKGPMEMGLDRKLSSSGRKLAPVRVTRLPSAQSDTLGINCTLDYNSSEDEPELYFTDPQQLLDLMTELTEQNLSLIQNSARVEEALEELQQAVETTRRKIEKEEEKIALQIKELNKRLHKEKARGVKLEQMVQLHVSLSSEDQGVMLDALGEKVAEVYSSCVENRITNLSTLEKVANIENCVSSLLQSLESMPEERLAMVKKIKDSEKRSSWWRYCIKYLKQPPINPRRRTVFTPGGTAESPTPCPRYGVRSESKVSPAILQYSNFDLLFLPYYIFRPISEDELKNLRENRYAAISDKQVLIDQKLQVELEAQEEKLRLEEEARNVAQRKAAKLARINRALPAWERSRTEEDILRAALRPGSKQMTSGPTSASEDSNALEWENDFVSTHPEDNGDAEFEGFVNPVLDTPSEEASDPGLRSDNQDR
ncbi:hypothetical protein GOODEAATRI_001801, partial [Goodea atripinnis]